MEETNKDSPCFGSPWRACQRSQTYMKQYKRLATPKYILNQPTESAFVSVLSGCSAQKSCTLLAQAQEAHGKSL